MYCCPAFLLTACIVTADQSVESNPKDPRAQDIVDRIRSLDLEPRQTTDVGEYRPQAAKFLTARDLPQ